MRERTKESKEVEGEVMKREKRDHVYVMQEHSHLPEQKSRLRCFANPLTVQTTCQVF